MAAHKEAWLPEVEDLRQVPASDLDRLLEEEARLWDAEYSWDFRPSADLVRRFVQMQSLSGYALRQGHELIGYGYQVFEDRKGLIGDFYVRPGPNSTSESMLLLGAIVQNLMRTPGVRRIESQLLLARVPTDLALPFDRYALRHDRKFMMVGSEAIRRLSPQPISFQAKLVPWSDRYQEDAAHLISAAYRGHVDSEINDQYRTIPGARRFLTNIVKYPGCGRFSPSASIVAIDEGSGRVCGMCLASLVSANSGHVTQICTLPGVRGSRLGYELLRRCLIEIINQGCTMVSLTVTCSNVEAIRLYESVGFLQHSTFPALVWEDF
jgi:ribosomal protein S18 acetylase RimI-like enzyme